MEEQQYGEALTRLSALANELTKPERWHDEVRFACVQARGVMALAQDKFALA